MRPVTAWRVTIVGLILLGHVGIALALWGGLALLTRCRFA